MLEATLNFQNRDQAQEFATRWAFKSKMGYSIKGSRVKIYNITQDLQNWIDAYVADLNAPEMSDDELLEALGM